MVWKLAAATLVTLGFFGAIFWHHSTRAPEAAYVPIVATEPARATVVETALHDSIERRDRDLCGTMYAPPWC
jgi:hypothetical protein